MSQNLDVPLLLENIQGLDYHSKTEYSKQNTKEEIVNTCMVLQIALDHLHQICNVELK